MSKKASQTDAREREARSEGLLDLFRREPGRTKALLRVVAAGLVLIAAWAFVSPLLLPTYFVVPIFLVLLAIYAGTIVLVSANLVRGLDRWQLESAVHARRLMTSTLSASAGATAGGRDVDGHQGRTPARRAELDDFLAPNFYDWYFSIRLEEEVKRHRREGGSMAVVVLQIAPPSDNPTDAEIERVDREMATLASDHQDKLKIPTELDVLQYGFYLPGMDSFEVKALVSRIVSALGAYWCYYGIAVYPEDASSGQALLDHARDLCDASIPRAVA